MTKFAVPIDEAKETIESHAQFVVDNSDWEPGDEWPDIPPAEEYPEAASSWCFVTGYANALGLTAEQLFVELGIDIQKLAEEE